MTMNIGKDDLVVVTGAGGFIGGWLTRHLLKQGFRRVRAVDLKPRGEWLQLCPEPENVVDDLRTYSACAAVCKGAGAVYNLAADMGGMGFIESHKAECMISVLINTNMLMAAREAGVGRYFFSSSACVYPVDKQSSANVTPLREHDVYPAMPEDGYGWEKLFSEQMCRHFREDFGLATRVGRYHNAYGPHGSYDGGREKAPAAICRKVIEAKLGGRHEIEIWGDGEQTRSFMYIDDCIKGTMLLTASEVSEPINIGSSRLVTINQLVNIVERIAGVKLRRRFDLNAPMGVRGRNCDNTMIRRLLGWEPSIRLEDGLETTYRWIYDQITSSGNERLRRQTSRTELMD
jgi:nucleoside-diphosphate-sugar epimerase